MKIRAAYYGFIFAAALSFVSLPLPAQSASQSDGNLFASTGEDDELFGGDSMFEEPILPEQKQKTAVTVSADGIIFEAGSVRFGGNITSELKAPVYWSDPYSRKNDAVDYFLSPEALLIPDLEASLFFDARPKENLRLYGKFKFAFPFEYVIPQGAPGTAPLSIPVFRVFELFTDFSWQDSLYFRFGKHTVKWGAGYFFSPADVINLSVIDPEHPEKEREGPVSLRAQIGIPHSQTNIWLYLLPDTETFRLEDTALAGKIDFLAGNYELSFGLWYKYRRSPRLTATVTGSIAGRVGIFAEGVAAWGSDTDWHNGTDIAVMYPRFQVTAGVSYTHSKWKTTVAGQYFYNGFGVPDPAGLSASEWISLKNLYSYAGQHYGAISIIKQELFTRKLSGNIFAIMGFSDFSGMANARLSWEIFSGCTLSAGPDFTFGAIGSEYTRRQGTPIAGFTVSAVLGGGKF